MWVWNSPDASYDSDLDAHTPKAFMPFVPQLTFFTFTTPAPSAITTRGWRGHLEGFEYIRDRGGVFSGFAEDKLLSAPLSTPL